MFTAAGKDQAVKVVVFTGSEAAFSTGMDLGVFQDMDTLAKSDPCVGRQREALAHIIQYLQDAISGPETCPVPVIAAINGACIGGAVDLITACDLRYCTDDAVFCIKETDLGIVADIGTLQRLPKLIGDMQTRELVYTARTFNGTCPLRERASRGGLHQHFLALPSTDRCCFACASMLHIHHTHTHTLVRARALSLSLSHTHTPSHAHTHPLMHTHTLSHTPSHAHNHPLTRTLSHTVAPWVCVLTDVDLVCVGVRNDCRVCGPTGQEAKRLGLVLESFATNEDMHTAVAATAAAIAKKPPLTMRGIKTTMIYTRDNPVPAGLHQVCAVCLIVCVLPTSHACSEGSLRCQSTLVLLHSAPYLYLLKLACGVRARAPLRLAHLPYLSRASVRTAIMYCVPWCMWPAHVLIPCAATCHEPHTAPRAMLCV